MRWVALVEITGLIWLGDGWKGKGMQVLSEIGFGKESVFYPSVLNVSSRGLFRFPVANLN